MDGTNELNMQDEGTRRSPIEYARQQASLAEPAYPYSAGTNIPNGSFPGYKVLKQIHHGGQGVVYLAEQSGTEQLVALKVLRSGPFSGTIERLRFQREIEVLAKLKHRNIVKLRDGGTVQGYQYLVMDFVDGSPLDVYMRQRKIGTVETLHLFLKVCKAVSAAHIRGVIHRDLKPANIMVDCEGEPYVLDFGLAKLVEPTDTHAEAPTITGQFLGSVAWTSPEQAKGTPEDIDARTDVHALGLVLFHLLTGELPFGSVVPAHEALRNAIESEPDKPSSYCPGIDDDLDVITLKCLAKDKEQRYQSVASLADDIEAHLAGRPIDARGDSTWYVFRKAAHRHRVTAIVLSLILIATLGYATTMTALYGRAVRAEREAEASAETAHTAFRKSQDTMELLVNDVATRLSGLDGAEQARKLILERAYTRLQELLVEKGDDPALQQDYARTLHGLGDIDEALGRHDQALQHFADALELRHSLAIQYPSEPSLQVALSIALVRVGDVAKTLGDREMARDYYDQALDIDLQLVEQNPKSLHYRDNLLWSHERLGFFKQSDGRLDTARIHFERMLELAEQMPSDAPEHTSQRKTLRRAHGHLFALASECEDWDTAVKYARLTVTESKEVFVAVPGNVSARRALASAYLGTTRALCEIAAVSEAQVNCAEADALIRPLIELDPSNGENRRLVMKYHVAMTAIAIHLKDLGAGDNHTREALDILGQLELQEPGNVDIKERLVGTLRLVVSYAALRGDGPDGRESTLRARSIAEELIDSESASVGLLVDYARSLSEAYPEELRDMNEAIRICSLAAEHTQFQHPAILRLLGDLYAKNGQRDKAIAIFVRALGSGDGERSPIVEEIRQRVADLTDADSDQN